MNTKVLIVKKLVVVANKKKISLPHVPIGDGLMSLISELSSSLMKGENCCMALLNAGEALMGDWLLMFMLRQPFMFM